MKNITKLLILLISTSTFSQSPWTPEKGKAYTQISFTSISGYNSLFGNPDYNTEREITDNTLQLFGEYGLTNKTSLLVNLPFKMIETGDLTSATNTSPQTINTTENSFGNISIGLKHNFYKKDWVLSGQISLEANTSTFNNDSGIRTGYDAWSITPLFLAGRGFGKTYVQAFVGADIRTNDYSSNFKIGGEIGRKLGKRIWLIGFLDISKSLENGNVALPIQQNLTGLYVNEQEYGSFGFKGIGEFTDNFGITAGFGGAFFGNNVAKQAALTFGVYRKF